MLGDKLRCRRARRKTARERAKIEVFAAWLREPLNDADDYDWQEYTPEIANKTAYECLESFWKRLVYSEPKWGVPAPIHYSQYYSALFSAHKAFEKQNWVVVARELDDIVMYERNNPLALGEINELLGKEFGAK